jgi:hypothetical protein
MRCFYFFDSYFSITVGRVCDNESRMQMVICLLSAGVIIAVSGGPERLCK